MKIETWMHLGRMSGGNKDREWRLQITDVEAGVTFLEIALTDAQFSDLLSNVNTTASAEVLGPELIGTLRETKHEIVTLPEGASLCRMPAWEARAILAPFEVDGWVGNASDLTNGHRSTGKRNQKRVLFTRNVPQRPEEGARQ